MTTEQTDPERLELFAEYHVISSDGSTLTLLGHTDPDDVEVQIVASFALRNLQEWWVTDIVQVED